MEHGLELPFDLRNRMELIRLLSRFDQNDITCHDTAILELFRQQNLQSMKELVSTINQQRRANLDITTVTKPRSYQQELIERVILGTSNYIVFLPTGTGKTLISIAYMNYMIEQYPEKHVVFLANSVTLVVQQYLAFLSQASIDREEVGLFYGGHRRDDNNLETQLRVIFATPVVYTQMLDRLQLNLHHASLIVFDEAHHCRKHHPYTKIMKRYDREFFQYRPKILGMSASPGEGKNFSETVASLKTLCEILDSELTLPRLPESLKELDLETNQSETTLLEYTPSDGANKIENFVQVYMMDCIKLFLEHEIMEHKQVSSKSNKFVLTGVNLSNFLRRKRLVEDFQLVFECFLSGEQKISMEDFMAPKLIEMLNTIRITTPKGPLFDLVSHVLQIWDTLEELTDFGAEASMEDLFNLLKHCQPENDKTSKEVAKSWNQSMDTLASQLRSMAQVIKSHGNQASKGGKVSILRRLLDNMAPDSKGIIFVQTRAMANKLATFLNTTYPKIGADCIVGKSEMSASAQLQAARGFNDSKFRLLVATSVVEEGIDIQSCDLVVRMDGTTTAKSLIQSRGRARNKSSKYMLIVTHEEKQHLELVMKREKYMVAAVKYLVDPEAAMKEGIDPEALDKEVGEEEITSEGVVSLNEYCQRLKIAAPTYAYQESEEAGPMRFKATVTFNDPLRNVKNLTFNAHASRKKDAQQKAALLLLDYLNNAEIDSDAGSRLESDSDDDIPVIEMPIPKIIESRTPDRVNQDTMLQSYPMMTRSAPGSASKFNAKSRNGYASSSRKGSSKYPQSPKFSTPDHRKSNGMKRASFSDKKESTRLKFGNPIGRLQEIQQKAGKPSPIYEDMGVKDGLFTCVCIWNGTKVEGRATNKKDAKNKAAEAMLKMVSQKRS